MTLRFKKVSCLPRDFMELVYSSEIEGHRFVRNTWIEWKTGKNTFSLKGESFFLVYDEDRPVACCGLNRDPYIDEDDVGRLRHLYVDPAYRRRGIATELAEMIINSARPHFKIVRLRANSQDLGSHDFYDVYGFSQSTGDKFETHRIEL